MLEPDLVIVVREDDAFSLSAASLAEHIKFWSIKIRVNNRVNSSVVKALPGRKLQRRPLISSTGNRFHS